MQYKEPTVRIRTVGQVPVSEYLRKIRSVNHQKMAPQLDRQSRHMTVIKPERQLGATWMDNFVARRKSVSLCHNCRNRYGDWYKKYAYLPHTRFKEITDCDGCSSTMIVCTGFWHETSTTGKILLSVERDKRFSSQNYYNMLKRSK